RAPVGPLPAPFLEGSGELRIARRDLEVADGGIRDPDDAADVVDVRCHAGEPRTQAALPLHPSHASSRSRARPRRSRRGGRAVAFGGWFLGPPPPTPLASSLSARPARGQTSFVTNV